MADKALEAKGARPMRLIRLKRPSAAKKALEANGSQANPMMPLRLKRRSPANKADEADGASAANEACEDNGARPMKPLRLIRTPGPMRPTRIEVIFDV